MSKDVSSPPSSNPGAGAGAGADSLMLSAMIPAGGRTNTIPPETIARFRDAMEGLGPALKAVVFGPSSPLLHQITDYDTLLEQVAMQVFQDRWSCFVAPPESDGVDVWAAALIHWEFITTTVVFHLVAQSEKYLYRLAPAGQDDTTRMVARLRLGPVICDPEQVTENERAVLFRRLAVPLSRDPSVRDPSL